MEGTGNEDSRTQEVAKITRALKGIARELDVPVVALSQLSRAVEMGGGPAFPKLAHLRESGSIEQDADVVMFIYRKTADSYFKNKDLTPQEEKIAEINIAKHRNGPTGTVKLYWNKESATFENLTEDRLPESYETVAS
jgi:replicative DNA helicase